MKILLDEKKGYLKANMHCHTTCSDGRLTPEEIKEEYMKRGYSVVAFTDHEHVIDQSHLTDDSFLAITGCEVAIKEIPTDSTLTNQQMKVCHLSFFALNPKNPITPCYNSVAEMEKCSCRSCFIRQLMMVDFPEPDGAEKIISFPFLYFIVVCQEGFT